jgi:hypothetical protein
MKVSPAIARLGERLALSFPEDSFRGVGFSLERWVGNAWQVQFYVSSDGAYHDRTPEWWGSRTQKVTTGRMSGSVAQDLTTFSSPTQLPRGPTGSALPTRSTRACALLTVAG